MRVSTFNRHALAAVAFIGCTSAFGPAAVAKGPSGGQPDAGSQAAPAPAPGARPVTFSHQHNRHARLPGMVAPPQVASQPLPQIARPVTEADKALRLRR